MLKAKIKIVPQPTLAVEQKLVQKYGWHVVARASAVGNNWLMLGKRESESASKKKDASAVGTVLDALTSETKGIPIARKLFLTRRCEGIVRMCAGSPDTKAKLVDFAWGLSVEEHAYVSDWSFANVN